MTVIDTNIFCLIVNGHPKVVDRLRRLNDDDLPRITVVTRVEVLSGWIKRFDDAKGKQNARGELNALRRFREFEDHLRLYETLDINEQALERFDELRNFIKRNKLRPRGRNDLWVAAVAVANSAVLVTQNVGDFQGLPDLMMENWAV